MSTSSKVLFVLALLAGAAAAGADTSVPPPESGPENGGLRLRLVIIPDHDADHNMITMELQNTGPQTVTLVGQCHDEEEKGDYQAFFIRHVRFVLYPEVKADGWQMPRGSARRSPQPQYELAPTKSLVVSWKTEGNELREFSRYAEPTPMIPSPGLYGVKASIVVVTKEGGRVLLVSNEQPMVVGGVRSLPKYATARIRSADPDKNLVTLDVGSDQKIEEGDTFWVHWSLAGSWRVTVTKVYASASDGSVTRLRHDGHGTPEFPQKGWQASLEPACIQGSTATNDGPTGSP